MLYILFEKIFGDFAGNVENSVLNEKQTDYLVNRYLLFVHEMNQGSKYAVVNKLKTMITDSMVSIVAKYARTYEQPNTTNFILFSNVMDALAIEENDRRFLVVHHTAPPKHQSYYDKLARTLTDFSAEIYSYLRTFDLTKFNPYRRPVETEAKLTMTSLSENEIDIHLKDLYEQRQPPFDRPILTIQNAVTTLSGHAAELKRGLSHKAIRRFILKRGYVERVTKIDGKSRRLWSADWRNLDKQKEKNKKIVHEIVREIDEAEQSTSVKNFK